MTLKIEVAAVLRAVRQVRATSYDGMKDASANSTIGLLERAKSGVTLDKLSEIAAALDFDLVTFVALCVALQRRTSPERVLKEASEHLQDFLQEDGQALMNAQLTGRTLQQRPAGKPGNNDNRNAVLKLKACGLSQAEAARLLSLPRSTVHSYWHQG
ncbi:transcriptional regulator with XRE-family HTH domain [Pseudomonas sp. BIGb0408]|uniref:Transcriptional regulator with XRE-family HTH domain n=1 Tax=Phytopseudomonas flavescens TaxID=29435 RepID=A0A7Y9XJ09_9GAMM|nr:MULTISPECIES: Cro/Cl family transcriptional regulator [Pseudomonas]MCW2293134.1 transcriptional regulator with XRE-family HTH domain [Pseudomonas sp. BIGb0408]NYH72296.1 transcriptional regulator with XRE-family HTH domain [Pseudomonas flavescens]